MKQPFVAWLVALLAIASACTHPRNQPTPRRDPTRSGNVVRFDSASPQLERIRVAPVTEAILPVDEFDVPGKVEPVPARLARLAARSRAEFARSRSRLAITSARARSC